MWKRERKSGRQRSLMEAIRVRSRQQWQILWSYSMNFYRSRPWPPHTRTERKRERKMQVSALTHFFGGRDGLALRHFSFDFFFPYLCIVSVLRYNKLQIKLNVAALLVSIIRYPVWRVRVHCTSRTDGDLCCLTFTEVPFIKHLRKTNQGPHTSYIQTWMWRSENLTYVQNQRTKLHPKNFGSSLGMPLHTYAYQKKWPL